MVDLHPKTASDARTGLSGVTVGVLTLLWTLVVLLPLQPWPFSVALDAAYPMALAEAFARGLRFGRDVVFTFGPFGFLFQPYYHPQTRCIQLAAWTLFAIAFWYPTLTIARRGLPRVLVLPWMIGLVVVGAVTTEGFLTAFSALLLVFRFYVDRRSLAPGTALLVLVAAWLSLVKFTYFMAMAVTIVAITVDDLRQRRVSRAFLLFVASWSVLWLGAGQRLGDTWSFLRTSVEVAGGYAAMSSTGPYEEVIAAFAVAALLLLLVARTAWRVDGMRALLPTGTLAVVLFLGHKAGFHRHDSHALTTAVILTLAAALYAAALPRPSRGRRTDILSRAVVVTASLGLLWLFTARYLAQGLPEFAARKAQALPGLLANAVELVEDRGELGRRYEANLARIRAEEPIPPATGRVDVYPWKIPVVLAHGLSYDPRPVLQSYVAFTPSLAGLNAEHLLGADAPDSILFEIATIDQRYPSLDDGPSWPVLLTRYDVADASGSFLLLRRRAEPAPYRLVPLATRAVHLGEPTRIPNGGHGPVWATLDIRLTALGRLAELLLRAPKVWLDVATRDGRVQRFRVIPEMARGGFLLSPLVVNTVDFALLASATDPASNALLDLQSVTSMTVVPASGGTLFYRPKVHVSLARLEFPRQQLPLAGDLARLKSLVTLAIGMAHTGVRPDFRVDGRREAVLLAHATSSITVPLPRASARARIGFGMLDGAWQEGRTDGVEFRVSVLRAGQAQPIWSRTLDPLHRPDDRGRQSGWIELPPGGEALQLETLQLGSDSWDWSYWSEITIDDGDAADTSG